jgi:hypothetical protein
MVASSSIYGRPNTGIPSRGGGNGGAIASMLAAGSPAGKFYREQGFSPKIGNFPEEARSGFAEAGHVAVVVAGAAPEGSSAAALAQEFLNQFPNSKVFHLDQAEF